MELKDVKHLAMLARLDIPEAELESVMRDLSSILGYIDQIKNAKIDKPAGRQKPRLRNVVREDIATNKPGFYTEDLLEEVPDTADGYVKVKKIL